MSVESGYHRVKDHVQYNFLFCSYGIRLAKALTELVFERGYTPFVVIRPHNDASRNLYTKLGYVKAYETCRVRMTPDCYEDSTVGTISNTSYAKFPPLPQGECVVVPRRKHVPGESQSQVDDEGIEDMLAEKCDISNEEARERKTTTDEGIGEDK